MRAGRQPSRGSVQAKDLQALLIVFFAGRFGVDDPGFAAETGTLQSSLFRFAGHNGLDAAFVDDAEGIGMRCNDLIS